MAGDWCTLESGWQVAGGTRRQSTRLSGGPKSRVNPVGSLAGNSLLFSLPLSMKENSSSFRIGLSPCFVPNQGWGKQSHPLAEVLLGAGVRPITRLSVAKEKGR